MTQAGPRIEVKGTESEDGGSWPSACVLGREREALEGDRTAGIPRTEGRCGSRTGGIGFLDPGRRLPKGTKFEGVGEGLKTWEVGFRPLCG